MDRGRTGLAFALGSLLFVPIGVCMALFCFLIDVYLISCLLYWLFWCNCECLGF